MVWRGKRIKNIARNFVGRQVREVKSGGGFLSFDAPIVYFGLGKYVIINKVEIVWSTGEITKIDKGFSANKKYLIIREKDD